MTIAAILSQVQDGKERPIEYASRQLNRAEQNYTVSEQEMLALVWATRYFPCYLYGKRFLVMIHHAALTYLQKFADHNSRHLRWSLKLSELDCVVEHRAGSKIGHVDAVSRHVRAITKPDPLSRESIRQEESKDAFYRRQNPRTYHSKSKFFLDSDVVMYRLQQNDKHQLVVPQALIQHVIRETHDP